MENDHFRENLTSAIFKNTVWVPLDVMLIWLQQPNDVINPTSSLGQMGFKIFLRLQIDNIIHDPL